eukprot:c17277_g1_i1 orf=3-203(-)
MINFEICVCRTYALLFSGNVDFLILGREFVSSGKESIFSPFCSCLYSHGWNAITTWLLFFYPGTKFY